MAMNDDQEKRLTPKLTQLLKTLYKFSSQLAGREKTPAGSTSERLKLNVADRLSEANPSI